MLDNSNNFLTTKNPSVQLLYAPDGDKIYKYLRLDLNNILNTIPTDITTNVTVLHYQNMSSQDYTIYYERSGGQIPTLGASCPPISTKSIQPQQAQEVRKLVEDARFFDLPTNMLPKGGAADYIGYTITIVEEKGMKRKHTVETSQFTTPIELRALIKYLNTLCRES